MGLSESRALSALRLSLGRFSTPGDIETAATLISKASG
jgi:cysteine desulfurase